MTTTDVLVRLRAAQDVPLVAYSTSGEWPALQALRIEATVEYLGMLKRAGADHILTFAAEQAAAYLETRRG
jgi:porphobilinogen synthase